MKQLYCYIFIVIFVTSSQALLGQGLINNGLIVNIGKISILNHKPLESGITGLLFNQTSNYEGKLVLTAERNTFAQDTLTGWVEYVTSSGTIAQQAINRIIFSKLRLGGSVVKHIPAAALLILDSAVIESTLKTADMTRSEIQSLGDIIHTGTIQPEITLMCVGTKLQTLDGNGMIAHTVIRNPAGIRLDTRAHVRITNSITLFEGLLQNQGAQNFYLSDNVLITRSAGGLFQSAPVFGAKIALRYVGNDPIQSGEEIPRDSNRTTSFTVMNVGGLTLRRNAYVLDSVIIASMIDTKRFMLALQNPSVNPVFISDSSHISGIFRRYIPLTDTLPRLFHNRYTWLQASRTLPSAPFRYVTFRIEPDTPPEPDAHTGKIRRTFATNFYNERFLNVIPDSTQKFRLGYAWQKQPPDETNGLRIDKVLLQRWGDAKTVGDWKTTGVPRYRRLTWNTLSGSGFWYRGETDSLCGSELPGYFALGTDSSFGMLPITVLNISLILEGMYRHNGQMSSGLVQKKFLPTTLPALYPYTLLGERREEMSVTTFPPETVDWLVVELRRPTIHHPDSSIFLPALLLSDGRVIQPRGGFALRLQRVEDDTTRWYSCAVHHRNHLGVITVLPLLLRPADTVTINFAQPETVRGGTEALKFLGVAVTGHRVWGLHAGDNNADFIINRLDYDNAPGSAWNRMFATGYLQADINGDGIVTTKDLNFIWNNRGKKSFFLQR